MFQAVEEGNLDLDVFKVQVRDVVGKKKDTLDDIILEENTKRVLIMPFLQILGYDVFGTSDVFAEYTCDFGVKRFEKVDFAIILEDKPYMIIEAKDCHSTLSAENVSQLYRYFSVCPAKLAILTNGIEYMLFTDSIEKNKMDTTPFYTFNMLDLQGEDIRVISKLHKSNYGKEDIIQYSKYTRFTMAFHAWYEQQKSGPTDDFIHYLRKSLNTFGLDDALLSGVIQREFANGLEDVDSGVVPMSAGAAGNAIKVPDGVGKVIVRNAVGVTGEFSLGLENIGSLMAGSHLVYASHPALFKEVTSIADLIGYLIDFCLDVKNYTEEQLVALLSSGYISGFFCKSYRQMKKYRGICFDSHMSYNACFALARKFCALAVLPVQEIMIGAVSRLDWRLLQQSKVPAPSKVAADFLKQGGSVSLQTYLQRCV